MLFPTQFTEIVHSLQAEYLLAWVEEMSNAKDFADITKAALMLGFGLDGFAADLVSFDVTDAYLWGRNHKAASSLLSVKSWKHPLSVELFLR